MSRARLAVDGSVQVWSAAGASGYSTEGGGPSSAARVLVVEDDRLVAMDIVGTLAELGYAVAGVAVSADQALEIAGRERPDLVLMDVKLQGRVDGVEAALALRAELDAPVVFLTANADRFTFKRALSTGAGGFLVKPFEARGLHHAIEVALEQRRSRRELEAENSLLRQDSTVDALTGLFNRRQLDVVLHRELEFARRDEHCVGLILLDLDHFKRLNDEYGHAAGDAVLRGVARVLCARVRAYDTLCRFGGEELVVVAPGAGIAETYSLAESLRVELGQRHFEDGSVVLPPVTASFGVAVFPHDADEPGELLRVADRALDAAKSDGRNCVRRALR